MPYSRHPDPAVDAVLRQMGVRVKHGRGARGWSQRALEGRCDVDQTTICRLEHGLARGMSLERYATILASMDR